MSLKDESVTAPARGSAREQILDVAQRLFAERGFDGVSIADIAREGRVSKANIFHHFESKDGLYFAVIAGVVARAPDLAPLEEGDLDVVTRFQEMAAVELREATKDERGMRLILQEIISGNPLRSRILAKDIFSDNFTRLVERIRAEQGKGTFRGDVDPTLAATALRSATAFFVLSRDVLRHLPGVTFADDPERYARETMALILNGLVTDATKGDT